MNSTSDRYQKSQKCKPFSRVFCAFARMGNNGSLSVGSAIRVAAKSGDAAALEAILNRKDAKACMNEAGKTGMTALYKACELARTECVELLIRFKVDMDICEFTNSCSPLMTSILLGHDSCAYLLIAAGCKLDLVTQDGATALFYAVLLNKLDLVEAICARRANLEISSHEGVTALSLAAEKGHADVVATLVKYGANIAAWDGLSGNTALHKASEYGHLGVVKILVESDASLDTANKSADAATALYLAVTEGHLEVAEYLLSKGANSNVGNVTSPLFIAAYTGNIQMVTLLLQHRADVMFTHAVDGSTPLMSAVLSKSLDCVQLLLANGADKSSVAKDGLTTALSCAEALFEEDIVLALR